MNDRPYSKRETDVYHDGLERAITRLEQQVKITNGRLTKLEVWKYTVAGGLGVILFLFPFLFYFFNNELGNLKDDMRKIRTDHSVIMRSGR